MMYQEPWSCLRYRICQQSKLLALLGFVLALSPTELRADCGDAPGPRIDWSGCSKEKLMLEGWDLGEAVFANTFLSGSGLQSANLKGANFFRAEVVRTSFRNSDLTGASLEKVLASRADFAGAKLQKARLVKAEFHRVDMEGADLTGADMSDGDFHRTNFAGANLTDANLTNALLPRSDLRGANLMNTQFGGVYLFRVRIEGVDLTVTKGLIQAQIDISCGDQSTKLPNGLAAPASWPCEVD